MSQIRFHPVDEDDANLRASHVIEMSENVNAPLSVPPSSSSPSPSPSAASSATPKATATDEIGAIPQAVTTSMASTATHPEAAVPPAVQAQAQVPHAESTRDLFSAKATTMAISAFKTPKNTILILVKAGLAKALLELWQIFILGVMAGMYVAIGTLTMTIITGGLSAEQKFTTSSVTHSRDPVTNVTTITSTSEIETRWFLPPGFQRLIQAAVFPLALIPVILAGAELFTSNVMFGLAARYGGKTTTRQMLRHWGCSYLGNFTGSVLFAFLLVYLTQLSYTEPIRAWLLNSANYKTHQGWGTMVLKGIGCNILVCLAVWQALVAEDVAGKILGIWWPLFGFIAIGFEHSIANMFTVPLALMEGLDVNFGDFLAWNLIPVTLGNVLGGGFFITVQWLVFREHLQVQLEKTVTRPGFKMPHDAAAIWAALTKRWNMAHSHAHPHITTPAQQAQAQLVGHNMYNYNQPPIVTSHVGHKQE